nr:DinB family protein [uncultured Pedobacter sp.]
MHLNYRAGAMGALLDEYEKAINELKSVIKGISDAELVEIKDPHTADSSCRSIQTILTHVVSSSYSYCVQIMVNREVLLERPQKYFRNSASAYIEDLDEAFSFNVQHLSTIKDAELEEFRNDKKILSGWGQLYDIEQMLEHAIVHILRHRRQINKLINQ